MRILADENIPFVREAFSSLGEVVTCSGREMDAEKLRDIDILLVRSITKVNAELIKDSPVRFVATATIGTDHLHVDHLAQRGIPFASASGSNAESVAQYVTAALLTTADRRGFDLRGKTVGVVGVGHVGSRVARCAEGLGMKVLLNDPPLGRLTNDPKYLPIEALFEADFLTLHVPLTREGADKTFHMVDEHFLRRMKPGSVLINTSRGAIVDNRALLRALENGAPFGAILDVWEGEPSISLDLLEKTELGTPHIAGYSFDGKVRGTQMIYEAACAFLGIEPAWDPADVMPAAETPALTLSVDGLTQTQNLLQAVRPIYDIERDDALLRKSSELPEEERAAYFDQLRKQYPRRREFANTEITLDPSDVRLAETFRALQFRIR